MTKPTLIIVSGFSCTGKTTLARKIGKEFSLPVFGRDDFKESLFDSLGYCDRQWSKKLGISSYRLLYLVAEKILNSGSSVIVESNFKTNPDTKKIKNIIDKYQCYLLQVHCYVEIPLALARFRHRAMSGERHLGHVDHLNYDEIEFNFEQGGYEILNICDANIRVDTTKFGTINYDNIFNKIRIYL
jgi:predicted kinase